MSQTVTVPGVGDLEFPDGMSQPDMAAAIQKNFPHIHPGGVPPPAQPSAASQGIPTMGGEPAAAAPPAPATGLFGSIRDGISTGLNVASDALDGAIGTVGAGVGLLGGLAGALGVKLTGGVQPDDPRVAAAIGAKPQPYAVQNGDVSRTPDAIDAASTQGAQTAIQGAHTATTAAGGAINPMLPRAARVLNTPGGRQAANDLQQPGGLMAHMDPQIGMAMHTPMGAAAESIAPTIDAARAAAAPIAEAAGNAAGAVGEAAGNAATGIAKAIVNPDPELVKVAQLNDTLEHPLPITPDKLTLDSAGNANPAQIKAGDVAVTKNLIGMINPEETATRLTPTVLDAALDRSGGIIGDIAEKTPIPVDQMTSALAPLVKTAIDEGAGDVPRIIPNLAKSLTDTADEDGAIPGTAFRKWDSNIGKKIRDTTDGGLRDELFQLQKSARDTMQSNITDPDDVAALQAARKQYAYGMIVAPDIGGAQGAGITGVYPAADLMRRVTSNARGKRLMATGSGGDIGDLAQVADLYTRNTPQAGSDIAAAVKSLVSNPVKSTVNAAANVVKAIPGIGAATNAVSNAIGQKVTRMLVPKTEPAAPPAPPELELAPPGPLAGAAPAPALGSGPLGDLTPDWETSPGAGRAAPGTAIDATDLHPALGEPPVTTGRPSLPSDGKPGSQIPAVPGRPDLPDTMIAGAPAEVAADEATNAAMQSPGAAASRADQAPKPAEPAAPTPPTPQPNAAEQTKLDEIDRTMASTQSDIVKATLQKERDRVMKDVTARDTVDKAKAAATELRGAAATITDPTTQKAMLAKADKLDPPAPPAPAPKVPKPEDEPLPSIEYADTPEWRQAHGLGPEDAQRAVLTRKAFDVAPDEVDAAAVQHANSPRAFDRAIDKILEKHHANETSTPAQGGQGAATRQNGAVQASGTDATDAAAGPQGAAGQPDAGAGSAGQPIGSGADTPLDEHVEAARLAQFELDHPRASDGTFVEREAPK